MPRREWPAWANLFDVIDLLRLSAPIAVSRASFMLMMLTDTIILGRNAPEELPFVLIAWFPIGVVLGIAMGLTLGVSVLTAELAGRGEEKETGRIYRRGIVIALLLGVIACVSIQFGAETLFRHLTFEDELLAGITAVCKILSFALLAQLLNNASTFYLEALRKPMIVSAIMYFGVIVNMVFDLIFVSGAFGFPKLGAVGVAYATSGTSIFLMIGFLILCGVSTPAFRKGSVPPPGELLRQVRVGLGMAVSNAAEFGAFNYTHVIAGQVSLAVSSIYGMVFQVIAFAFMAFLGIGTATSVRVAERIGRGDEAGVVNASRLGVFTCIVTGVLAAGIMLSFPESLASVFVKPGTVISDVELYPVLASMIMLSSLMVIFDGLQNTASMASRARGLIWPPAFVHIGCYLLIMIPLAWYLSSVAQRGLQGIMEAVIVSSVVSATLQLYLLERRAPVREQRKTAEGL
ncbi:MAG: multidrug transporter [Ponticaulis sp.]|nr:multidrug transporter [Ponticaulis sp.]